mgnify:CR=1 FL=1
MHDAVKNESSGYASFNYEEAGHVEVSISLSLSLRVYISILVVSCFWSSVLDSYGVL